MFKRKKPLSYMQWFREGIFPRAGWKRAINYIALRLKRLPDTPHKISIGFACGAFVSFSPMFGFHFIYAGLLAYIFRGNILSAFIGTFVGNPITFPFIGVISYRFGVFLLGMEPNETAWQKIKYGIIEGFDAVFSGITTLFLGGTASWDGFIDFFHNVFVPYYIGGLIPGFSVAIITYIISKPLVITYQERRRKKPIRENIFK